jgi:hypothetical protein
MDIRIRQNIFLITDKIYNKVSTNVISVSSGSLAEGLDLPGSDTDIMWIINGVTVIQNVQHMHRSPWRTTLLMEDDTYSDVHLTTNNSYYVVIDLFLV